MLKSFRAAALLLMAAALARPAAAQKLPPVTSPAGAGNDTLQVQLELAPDSLVAEPVEIDSVKLAWLQTPPALRDLVCDRIGCFETDVPHTFNNAVMSYVNYFTARNRAYTQRVLEREKLYFPLFEKYLAKYNLPQDLKYLAVVESALIPTAKSKVGATGLWQFMGPTAGDLRLRRDEWVDERMDPEKSTEAACKHLRYLYGMFHDWELVLAAYNWGGGSMKRVMARTGKKNFWDLYPHLPKETRNYVPTFTAIMYTMKYAEQHKLHSPELRYQVAEPMDTLQLGGLALDIRRLSQAAGLDSMALQRYNPELRKHYLPYGYRPYAVQIPAAVRPKLAEVDRATLFDYCRPQAELPKPLSPLPPRLDGVEPFYPTYAGRTGKPDSSAAVASMPTSSSDAPRTRRKLHTVRKGQTLAELAGWYGVSQAQLRKWNNLPKGRALRSKQQLVVFLPAQEAAAPAEVVAARPKATPSVAAAPRTPSEMGVKVAKRTVAKPAVPVEEPVATVAKEENEPADASPVTTRKPAATPEASQEKVTKQAQTQVAAATEYVVRKGDYLTKLAREQNLSVADLMTWNQLKSEVVTPGQKLRLTAPADSDLVTTETPAVAQAAPAPKSSDKKKARTLLPEEATRVHIVQPGDTLYNISRRYQGLTVDQLRKLNNLKSDEVKPGQKLLVAG